MIEDFYIPDAKTASEVTNNTIGQKIQAAIDDSIEHGITTAYLELETSLPDKWKNYLVDKGYNVVEDEHSTYIKWEEDNG